MKKLILFLFVTFVFAACKKESDVNPKRPAEAVAGSYKLNSFYYTDADGETKLPNLPLTQSGKTISGTVVLDHTSDNTVSLTLTLKATGQQDATLTIDNVEVKKTSEAYGLYADGTLVADADGNNIIFNLSETAQTGENIQLKFTASK